MISYKNFLLPDTHYTLCTERYQPNKMINCMVIKNEDVKLVVLITVKIYKFDSFRTDSFFDFFYKKQNEIKFL